MYFGDYNAGDIVDFKFTTVGNTGAPTTLAGTPSVLVYKGNGTTESGTTGITLSVDFDGRTGLNHVRIDTSQDSTFYANANEFQVVITAGTVGGTSVVGYVVGHFSLRNRGATLRGITHTGAVIPTVSTLTGHTPQTGDTFVRLGAPVGASISVDVAAINSITSVLPYKKNTALNNFHFVMTDDTDNTPKTGLVNGDFTKKIVKDSGTEDDLTGTVTEVGAGWYRINLTASEMNADNIGIRFSATGANTTMMSLRTSP